MDLEELSAYLGNTSEAFDHLNSAILIVYRERDLYTGKAGKHIEKQTFSGIYRLCNIGRMHYI